MELEEYLNLITSEHRDKPNFIAMTSLDLETPIKVQELLKSLYTKFDVDNAVGQQLDVIGQWAGISRNVSITAAGVYLQWDGVNPYVGWDFGSWKPETEPTTITSLPDDAYRTLIKGKIASNQWNGTTEGAYAIWDSVLQGITILIQDNQNMSYGLGIVGGIVDSLTLALITSGYIPLKPEGVRVSIFYIPVNTGPLFGWDIETQYVEGWDSGSWTREITP